MSLSFVAFNPWLTCDSGISRTSATIFSYDVSAKKADVLCSHFEGPLHEFSCMLSAVTQVVPACFSRCMNIHVYNDISADPSLSRGSAPRSLKSFIKFGLPPYFALVAKTILIVSYLTPHPTTRLLIYQGHVAMEPCGLWR